MATRKPLVLGADGLVQQLQAADTLGITSETGQINQIADATMIAGNAVYSTAADHIGKARANATGTSAVLGLCIAAITNAATGTVQTNGILALTTGQWDALTGSSGGLTFNVPYFLDPTTAGLLTATPPTTVGQLVVLVGRAISTTELNISIEPQILL